MLGEMEEDGSSLVEVHRNLQGFMTILTSAACEWFLIFMLLINAALSYLLTKFADYCKLQRPCILCSRLDHVIGNRKPKLYLSLLCCDHISQIYSLISSQIHSEVTDGHGMCEDCILSSTKKNKLHLEMHRFLGGKLGLDISGSGVESLLLDMDLRSVSLGTRPFSCCGKLCKPRKKGQKLFCQKLSGSVVPKCKIPLPRLPSHSRIRRCDSFKKIRNKFYGSVAAQCLGKGGFDSLSHVAYTELQKNSDSDSEVPFSDDNDSRSRIHGNSEPKEDLAVPCAMTNPSKAPFSEFSSAKVTTSPYNSRHLLSNPSALPDLILFDEILPLSNVLGISHRESIEKNEPKFPLQWESNHSGQSDLNDTPSLVGTSSETYFTSLSALAAGMSVKAGLVISDLASVKPKHSDSCESPGSDRERESSGFTDVRPFTQEADRFGEVLLSSSEDTSDQTLKLSIMHGDEEDINSISNEIHMLRQSASIESGLESLDGSNVSETEGESIVDRLKRQVQYDRKCMNSLYKELEEERNASAVAASQAMAMITRLQDEKAALRMEALQYLRMMEEQAEYDVEALEKANELLAEKEKEIQDLEAELEYCRLNFPDETTTEG